MLKYQVGEMFARKCLQANGYQVIDRTQQQEYWKKDIDLTASKDGYISQLEIKWDTKIHKSGAMFIELLTNIQENKQGWMNYTQADYIWYGDAERKVFYIFRAEDMRRYLREHKGEYETRIANDYNYLDGSIRKQSLGAIVPIGHFRQFVRVQELDITERLKNEAVGWPLRPF